MSNIFVTGHRNPDTDSIIASIAYANLRNALGDTEYKAARIGQINDETRRILKRFNAEEPELIKSMKTQIRDLDYDKPPELRNSVTMDLAWKSMKQNKIASMPILNADGTIYGMLSAGDIATYDMQTLYDSHIENLPIFNLISVIEGIHVNLLSCNATTISGDVKIAVPSAFDSHYFENGIVICGSQRDIIEKAIDGGANCVIVCQADIDPKWEQLETPVILSSPLDARTISRVIYTAMPVEGVCARNNLVCFHLDDYLDDVKEVLLESRFRCYPVLDENEKVVGTISRYHLLKPNRKKVVLVDHNEAAQSVYGLDQVEIMEIIDHHRLADIQTLQPISVRNEPVGSTNTILTSMYQERGILPSPDIAGMMAAAILSDTVLFKSPTCTPKDRAMAERLAKIADVSLEDLGKELFAAPDNGKSAEDLFKTDYKIFHIADQNIGVSQITCIDVNGYLDREDEFLEVMAVQKKEKELDIVILMLTDVLKEGSYIIYLGNDDIISQAFGVTCHNQQAFLPGVMSRKKQIIPMLTALWG